MTRGVKKTTKNVFLILSGYAGALVTHLDPDPQETPNTAPHS